MHLFLIFFLLSPQAFPLTRYTVEYSVILQVRYAGHGIDVDIPWNEGDITPGMEYHFVLPQII